MQIFSILKSTPKTATLRCLSSTAVKSGEPVLQSKICARAEETFIFEIYERCRVLNKSLIILRIQS
jgi:hypothetical protein